MDSLQCYELYEHEESQRYIQVESYEDPVILADKRVLENMMNDERTVTNNDYCSIVQSHIAPHMRKIVTDWMLEVCEDQQCQAEVFFLSVNYLDTVYGEEPVQWTGSSP